MKKRITLLLAIVVLVLCVVCQYTFYFLYDPYPIQINLPFWFSIPRIVFVISAFTLLTIIFKEKKFQLKSVVLLLVSALALLIVLIAPGKFIYVMGMKYRLKSFIETNSNMLKKHINSDEKINQNVKLNWLAIAPKGKLYNIYKDGEELTITLYEYKGVVCIVCLIYSEKKRKVDSGTELIPLTPKWSLLIGNSAVPSNDYP